MEGARRPRRRTQKVPGALCVPGVKPVVARSISRNERNGAKGGTSLRDRITTRPRDGPHTSDLLTPHLPTFPPSHLPTFPPSYFPTFPPSHLLTFLLRPPRPVSSRGLVGTRSTVPVLLPNIRDLVEQVPTSSGAGPVGRRLSPAGSTLIWVPGHQAAPSENSSDQAQAPKTRKIDALRRPAASWEYFTMPGETQNPFSLTRPALGKAARRKSKVLTVFRGEPGGKTAGYLCNTAAARRGPAALKQPPGDASAGRVRACAEEGSRL